jgi:hypothetical protein
VHQIAASAARFGSLVALPAQLLADYSNCKNSGQCEIVTMEKVDGLILENLFNNGKLLRRCLYSNPYEDKAGGKIVESGKFPSSAIVFSRSGINFLKSIDKDSSSISQISPSYELSQLHFDPNRPQSARVNLNGDLNGLTVEDVLGRPELKNCPAYPGICCQQLK